MTSDIKACQARGKIITLSMGGSVAGVTSFSSDAQAEAFARTVWDLFLGGSSSTRPFGDAVLDGWSRILFCYHENALSLFFSVDLDLEAGSSTYVATFVNSLRSLWNGASKRLVISSHLRSALSYMIQILCHWGATMSFPRCTPRVCY